MFMKTELYPVSGERYTHYKGGTYEIISMAIHTETQEKMVVYKSLSFGSIYVRPYEEFIKPAKDGYETGFIARFKKLF